MKIPNVILGLMLIAAIASAARAQQHFTYTVTELSKNCNATCSVLDVPELNDNPLAVVFVAPVVTGGRNRNPHPVGAYYMYLKKWSVFNLDGAALPVGAVFDVEYFVNPDSTRFVYVVPQRVHPTDLSYVDHAGLNGDPNAQIRFTAHASDTIGNIWNKNEVKFQYDTAAAKWFIANINNTPVPSDSAYNIIFSNGPTVSNPNANTPIHTGPQNTVPGSANPNAGGDLSGTYPNPTVIGLQGRPLGVTPPTVGQVLKWNGLAWQPANEKATTPAPTAGQVLKWNGTVWVPGDDNVGSAETLRSYGSFLTADFVWNASQGGPYEVGLPGMSIQVTITRPSMVNISVFVQTSLTSDCGLINNCGSAGTGINLYRDNTLLVKTMKGPSDAFIIHALPNYPELLNPGTYTYKVLGRRIFSNSSITYFGGSNPAESFKSYIRVQVVPQ